MAKSPSSRTFVLVHGMWHGGWCWSRVAEALRARGHRVTTPTQTGLGERKHLLSASITLDTFVADVVNHLEWEDLSEVVLVGHSFGGAPISGAADGAPERIAKLIYLDAAIMEDGETWAHYISCAAPAYRPTAICRDRAQDRGWPVSLLATGHDAMVSDAQATAAMLDALGREP